MQANSSGRYYERDPSGTRVRQSRAVMTASFVSIHGVG